jgi:Transposase
MELFCGIDWAEGHHDVALVDTDGTKVAKMRIDTGAKGFSDLESLLAEHSTAPSLVPVAIETDKNLIVVALLAAGHTV